MSSTFEEVLAGYEASSWAEMISLVDAQARLRAGADPLAVLDDLEASRERIVELATLEHEEGMGAVFDRVWADAHRDELRSR